jgi:hypothetical protein
MQKIICLTIALLLSFSSAFASDAVGRILMVDYIDDISVSTSTQTALNLKANLASPNFTGSPTAPNQSLGDNSTKIANTAYVDATAAAGTPDATTSVKGKIKLAGDLAGTADLPTVPALTSKADLSSPTFTGVPLAPTASANTNNTQISTTAYSDTSSTNAAAAVIIDSIADSDTTHAPSRNATFDALALKANLASPTFTGTVTVPSFIASGSMDLSSTSESTTTGSNANIASASVFMTRLTNASLVSVGGYNNASSGRIRYIHNDTGNAITVINEDVTIGTSSNRFLTGTNANLNIPNNSGFFVMYTSAVGRQFVMGSPDLSAKANLASPTFTGTPLAPTPSGADNSTKIATTAFVNTAITTALSGYPLKAWVNFDGTVAGTFAGGASTVSRTSGSTTATITTTSSHGLISGNAVWAASGVVAGHYVVTVLTSTTFTITTVATTTLSAVAITFNFLTIKASGNVSSVTDNGTGDFSINFSVAMSDVNYAASGTAKIASTNSGNVTENTTSSRQTGHYRANTAGAGGTANAVVASLMFVR